MSTKFFNNQDRGNTLFKKIEGITRGMQVHSFMAVVGFFRSSGYFK